MVCWEIPKNYAKQKVIQAALGIVDKLKKEIEDVIKQKIDLEVKHFQTLYDLGIRDFGENKVQEILKKKDLFERTWA